MEYLVQGGISLDYFTRLKGDDKDRVLHSFLKLINPNDLKIKEIILEGVDGKLHTINVESSEMEIDVLEEIDEDTPKKYKNCQMLDLTVLANV
ncbi:hypothetical protein CHH83_02170 [Bacillus sp. 7586-K]|nr:hypothetical protein CHH83_02170 [Bacillus sp. 7586-K]